MALVAQFYTAQEISVCRKQRVMVNVCSSQWTPETSGKPQGSVLGPMMFELHVNDMPDAVHSTLMFADDATVFSKIENTNDRIQLQSDFCELKT